MAAHDGAACDALALLLEYPGEGWAARVRAAASRVAEDFPQAHAELEPLVALATTEPLAAAEESYVRTFDGNAERALEVGWQVFGEQYARGAFLVRLRERMRALGVEETTELPDHLSQVLRLLPRLPEEEARDLVSAAVAPALARLGAAFADREDDPWRGVVAAVGDVLGLEPAATAAAEAAHE
jgi:nitrate reductase molybdenum cofactor assembly chaperone